VVLPISGVHRCGDMRHRLDLWLDFYVPACQDNLAGILARRVVAAYDEILNSAVHHLQRVLVRRAGLTVICHINVERVVTAQAVRDPSFPVNAVTVLFPSTVLPLHTRGFVVVQSRSINPLIALLLYSRVSFGAVQMPIPLSPQVRRLKVNEVTIPLDVSVFQELSGQSEVAMS
jgi:hypothetical protein